MISPQGFSRWLGVLMLLAAATAAADEAARFSVIEENDGIITHKDRYYTQGLQVSDLSADLAGRAEWKKVFDAVGVVLPTYRDGETVQRRFEYVPIGQALFTPHDTSLATPDPSDRPYGAWLYTGLHLLQENDRRSLNNLELLIGVVGPSAFGREVQNGYHLVVGDGVADGWPHQLHDRVAGQLSYDYKRRLMLDFGSRYGADIIPEAGISLGNVYRYIDGGVLLRLGNALDVDYGPEHLRPALSGTAFGDYRRLGGSRFHWYLYAGMQERWVSYNLFIDGAPEVASRGLSRPPTTSDFVAGASLFFGRFFRADFLAARRSTEFNGQQGPDVFGGVNMVFQ